MRYIESEKLSVLVDSFENEMGSFNDIKSMLINVLDFDDSRDLTDIHPKDRDNVSVHVMFLWDQHFSADETIQERFKDTRALAENLPGVDTIKIIAVGPNSIVPLHLDDMERPAFDLNSWYSVLVGVIVPSSDQNLLALQSDDKVYNHSYKQCIIFDTQIPHQAWNHTNQWWLMLRLSIKKEFFIE